MAVENIVLDYPSRMMCSITDVLWSTAKVQALADVGQVQCTCDSLPWDHKTTCQVKKFEIRVAYIYKMLLFKVAETALERYKNEPQDS